MTGSSWGWVVGSLAGGAQVVGGGLVVAFGGPFAPAGAALIGSGMNGITYSLGTSNEDFSAGGLIKKSVVGAATGAVTAGVASWLPTGIVTSAISGAAGNLTQPLATAAVEMDAKDLSASSLAKDALIGAVTGGVSGAAGKAIKSMGSSLGSKAVTSASDVADDAASAKLKTIKAAYDEWKKSPEGMASKTLLVFDSPPKPQGAAQQVAKFVSKKVGKATQKVLESKVVGDVLKKADPEIVKAMAAGGVTGAASHAAGTVTSNYIEGKKLTQGVLEAAGRGATIGAAIAGINAGKDRPKPDGEPTTKDAGNVPVVAPIPIPGEENKKEGSNNSPQQTPTAGPTEPSQQTPKQAEKPASPDVEAASPSSANTSSQSGPISGKHALSASPQETMVPASRNNDVRGQPQANNPARNRTNGAQNPQAPQQSNSLSDFDERVLDAKRSMGKDLMELGLNVPEQVIGNEERVREFLHKRMVDKARQELINRQLTPEYRSHLEALVDPRNKEMLKENISLSAKDVREWQRDLASIVPGGKQLNPMLADPSTGVSALSDKQDKALRMLDDKIDASKKGIDVPVSEQQANFANAGDQNANENYIRSRAWRPLEEYSDELVSSLARSGASVKSKKIWDKLEELYSLRAERAETVFNGYREIPRPALLPAHLYMQ